MRDSFSKVWAERSRSLRFHEEQPRIGDSQQPWIHRNTSGRNQTQYDWRLLCKDPFWYVYLLFCNYLYISFMYISRGLKIYIYTQYIYMCVCATLYIVHINTFSAHGSREGPIPAASCAVPSGPSHTFGLH